MLTQTRLGQMRLRATGDSVREIAERLKVSPTYLDRVERGECDIRPRDIGRLAKLYAVPPTDIALAWYAARSARLRRWGKQAGLLVAEAAKL